MRIISKFKDYYDSAAMFGHDTNVVFVREQQKTLVKYNKTYASIQYDDEGFRDEAHRLAPRITCLETGKATSLYPGGGFKTNFVFLYFCGKLYAFLGYNFYQDNKFHNKFSFEKDFDFSVLRYSYLCSEETLKRYLDTNFGKDIDPAIHFHFNSPIVMYIADARTINPTLSDFRFQKVVDPFQAHQEIEMFLGGVMSNNANPPSPMTDKEKVVSHGMDPKWSFRKMSKQK